MDSISLATTGHALKSIGNSTVEGFKTVGNEISTAVSTSHIKKAPEEFSKSVSTLKGQIAKDMETDNFSSNWAKFSANIKEVFGNARTNLSNKQFHNIFQPPKITKTEDKKESQENSIGENQNEQTESSKKTFTPSQIYKIKETDE